MSKTYKKILYSENEQHRLQRRLSHFLKSIKYKNKCQSKDLARKLDYTPERFSELESDRKPHGRFINSLSFLSSLAKLDSITLSEFVHYLETDNDRFQALEQAPSNRPQRELRDWEKIILRAFSAIDMRIHEQFIEKVCDESLRRSRRKFELILSTCIQLIDEEEATILNLVELLKGINSKNLNVKTR